MGIAKAGNFVLRVAEEVSRIYITAYFAARMVRQSDKKWEDVSKEGNVKIFNAENIDLGHFNPIEVVYTPKAVYTQAVQVTPGNVGALTLEFETELMYADDVAWFRIFVERRNEDNSFTSTPRMFSVGDWIVPLRNEIHKFRDDTFITTFHFSTESSGSHSANLFFTPDSGEISGPSSTQVIPRVQE